MGLLLLLLLPLASLAAATAAAARPNILLFFPDELRYDFGGLHNNPYYPTRAELPIFTPHFDSVALAGVRFTRAFVGAPVCAPSRACLASGRQYDENTVPMNFHTGERAAGRWLVAPCCTPLLAAAGGPLTGGVAAAASDFNENVTTFYKLLRDKAGYHTMVTGRDDLDKSSGGPTAFHLHGRGRPFPAHTGHAESTLG